MISTGSAAAGGCTGTTAGAASAGTETNAGGT
jgi:hypothetical protein